MFRSTARNLGIWWTAFSDDILGADLEPAVYDEDLEHHLHHPHRQPLRLNRQRREGTVSPRPGHCLSPVRTPVGSASATQFVGAAQRPTA